MPTILLSQMRSSICTRFYNTAQATEIIKKCKFSQNSHHRCKHSAYEKVTINVIGKTILRSAVHAIEKLSKKLNKPKLN